MGTNFGKYRKETRYKEAIKKEIKMRVNIQEMLKDCGLEENVYPGKRVIQKLPQTGENKSHCVVYDWRAPGTLRVEVKPGLHGKSFTPQELKKFPLSFQAATYLEIGVNQNEEQDDGDDESETEGSAGGGGGKKIGAKKPRNAFAAFSQVVEGNIPDAGAIKKFVVMGKEIAKEAYQSVLGALQAQIRALAVVPVNILAAAQAVKVTIATPGGGLAPRGNEDVRYKYKGAEMFGLELKK